MNPNYNEENRRRTQEERPYRERTVRNNGKKIGRTRTYVSGIKKSLLIGSFVVVSVASFKVGEKLGRNERIPVYYNTLRESYFDEPTYNGIPYKVQPGDNLTSIVYSYQTDPNKVQAIIRQIKELNKMNNENSLRDGVTILLCGVPADKLGDYGYTDDYNYFDPDVEIDLRLSYLQKVCALNIDTPEFATFKARVDSFLSDYKNYKYTHVENDESGLNDLIERLRYLCEDGVQYGYRFEDNLKALPLDQATRNLQFLGVE